MRLTSVRPLFILLLLVLMLPSIGPLADHHFADHQHSHHHLTRVGYHTHLSGQHDHLGDGPAHDAAGGGTSVPLYNHDSGQTATVVPTNGDTAVESVLVFEPSSIFRLPPPPKVQERAQFAAPPDKPPRSHA